MNSHNILSLNRLRFKTPILFILILTCFSCIEAIGQTIGGTILNSATCSPIPFANVSIPSLSVKGKKIGVASDKEGVFLLAIGTPLPLDIEFSAIGYKTKRITITRFEANLKIELEEDYNQLDDIIVTSEKISIEELRIPNEITRISLPEIQNSASFNFIDLVANIKGVDITTQSLLINNVNTRGFNSNANQRFTQYVDGMDNQAPGLSFALGNIIGPSQLDIESIEVIPGAAASQYGTASFNGVLSMKTKNPFDHTGFSMAVKGATLSIEQSNSEFFRLGNFSSDLSARYAVNIKDKVAFKIAGTSIRGVDFRARNYDNIGPGNSFETNYSELDQAINGVNVYGDDRVSFVTVPKNRGDFFGPDTLISVTRRGYREEDLVEYNANNFKFNAEVQAKLNKEIVLSLASFYGITDAMITGNDRIALREFEIQQYKVAMEGRNFFARAYTTTQNSGKTFNVGLLADNLVQIQKPDSAWFDQYRRLHTFGFRSLQASRSLAESKFPFGQFLDRFEPGTERFDSLRNVIVSSQEPGLGAAIRDKSSLYHLDAGYNLKDLTPSFDKLNIGYSLRYYKPESAGTVFIDSVNNDVFNWEYGIFGEVERPINESTRLYAALRYDKNANFKGKLSQRLTFVKQHKENHFFRLAIQRGFRFPNINEQFINQDLGDLRLIGGLKEITDAYDLHNNSILQSAVDEFISTVNQSVFVEETEEFDASKSKNISIIENGVIRDNQFLGLKPEQITSLEFGYRSLIEEKRLIEVTAYRNYYRNFIGNTRLIIPRTSPSIDLNLAMEQSLNVGSHDVVFVADNSEKTIVVQGLEMLYDITGDTGLNFVVNATLADIIQDADDPLVPGFNTPPFKFNVKVGHRRIGPNFGAEFVWRSRSGFEWESPFQDGFVKGYSTFDMQLTFGIPKLSSFLRVGANNAINIDQFNSFGGPEINAIYYASLTSNF